MYKNILNNKNVNMISFFIQFIYIFIIMYLVRLFSPFVCEYVGFYICQYVGSFVCEYIIYYLEREIRKLPRLIEIDKTVGEKVLFSTHMVPDLPKVRPEPQQIFGYLDIRLLNKGLDNFGRLPFYVQIKY
jgi:small-conductance mechanosensitive channel